MFQIDNSLLVQFNAISSWNSKIVIHDLPQSTKILYVVMSTKADSITFW